MKTKYLNRLALIVLAFCTTFVMSCSSDSDEPEEVGCDLCPKEEGWYVYGTNTIADGPSGPNAKMSLTATEPWSAEKTAGTTDGIFGKYMYIGAGGTLNFAKVTAGEGVIYGDPSGGTLTPSADANAAMDEGQEVIFGQMTEGAGAIAIAEEGLYFVVVSEPDNTFTIVKTNGNIIGDATPDQWNSSTPLPQKSVSADGAVFEATGVEMLGAAGYRLRVIDGWHAYAVDPVKTVQSLGVQDYATAWDIAAAGDPLDIGYLQDNIPFVNPGVYTITLTYKASDGSWTQGFEKTGDLIADYSTVEVGFNGNAFYVDGAAPSGDWMTHYDNMLPTVADDVHSWKWTGVHFVTTGAFAMVDAAETIWIVWDGVGRTGAAFENGDIIQENSDNDSELTQNFKVVTEGNYDVTFNIYPDGGRELNIVPTPES